MELIIVYLLFLMGNLMYVAKNIHDYMKERKLSHLLLAAMSLTAVIFITITIAVKVAQKQI